MRVTWLAPLLVGIPAVLALVGAEASINDNSRLTSSLDALVRRGDPDIETELLLDLIDQEVKDEDPVPPTKTRSRRPVTPTTSIHTTPKKKKTPKTKTYPPVTTPHIVTVPPTTHTTSRHTTPEAPQPTAVPSSHTSPVVIPSHSPSSPPSPPSSSPTQARTGTRSGTRASALTSTTETGASPIVVLPTVDTSVSVLPTPTSSPNHPSPPSSDLPPLSPDPTPSPSPDGSSSVTPSPGTAPTFSPIDPMPVTVPITSSGVSTRRPRPTGTLTPSLPGSNSTTSPTGTGTTSTLSGKPTTSLTRPTTIPTPTTTKATTTTTTTTTTITTTTTTTTTTRSHRPTKTTTPWLPTTIEPVTPPKKTQTASPGTSLPDVVIPNLHPDIPEGSFNVHLRLQHVSYYQVINNGILAAQLVNFLPAQLSQVLDVDTDQVLVLAIRDASVKGSSPSPTPGSKSGKKRGVVTSQSEQQAILVTVAIPKTHYQALAAAIADTNGPLYTPSADTFGQYLDASYPLSNQPPTTPSGGSKGTAGDPSPLTGDQFGIGGPDPVRKEGGSGSTNGVLIGTLVGAATIAYVGIAMVVVRAVRRKRMRQQEEEQRAALQRSISGPMVSVQGGATTGWGWNGTA